MMLHAMDYAKLSTDANGKTTLLNPGTNVPRIITGADVNGTYSRITNKYVEDGSYLRLKNVSLSYNIPTSLLARQKLIRGIRATVGAQNLATITGYSGYDPEANTRRNNPLTPGVDYAAYPRSRFILAGVNVTF